MVTTLLHTALLSGLETCLNHVIALDPAATGKLQAIAGKVLQVRCRQPALTVNIMVTDQGMLLTGNAEIPPDATITGTPAALLKRLLTRDTANLRGDSIIIGGDTGLIDTLQKIFSTMDVDWEYRLSRIIGDIPTQLLSDGVAGATGFLKRSRDNLAQDIDAYLHEEKKLLPDSRELQHFYRGIDSLRLRVDRLQARTSRLQSRLSH